jgi:hypothetical protein
VKPVVYHTEASAEFDAAAERYESLSAGLGGSFIDEVRRLLLALKNCRLNFPSGQATPAFKRRFSPRRFPSSCSFAS